MKDEVMLNMHNGNWAFLELSGGNDSVPTSENIFGKVDWILKLDFILEEDKNVKFTCDCFLPVYKSRNIEKPLDFVFKINC